MIRSVYSKGPEEKKFGLTIEEIQQAIQDPNGFLWISLEQTSPEEAMPILHDLFQFHPLAIEDCLNTGYQTPKVDDYSSYIFIIAHAVRNGNKTADLETMELNFFLSSNYLVTLFLDEAMPPVDYVWQRLERDERLVQRGTDFLSHAILDKLVDDYMPILDKMDDEIEWLEDQVLARPSPDILENILDLKHGLLSLRRITSPQRELMNILSRDEFPMIDPHSQFYFRDLYDHLVRYHDLVESLRDIVAGAMDIYLNSTSLRLNNVMKALTIVSTIFLPLSFVAGVYGMNFENMPMLHWEYGYLVTWMVFIIIAAGMLIFFKRRGWF